MQLVPLQDAGSDPEPGARADQSHPGILAQRERSPGGGLEGGTPYISDFQNFFCALGG